MNDDSIRESHGCKCLSRSVFMREVDTDIIMEIVGGTAVLTRWQARYIASKLYRLARRIRDREGETK